MMKEKIALKIKNNIVQMGTELRDYPGDINGIYFEGRKHCRPLGHIFSWVPSFFTGMAYWAYVETKDSEFLKWLYSFKQEYYDKVFSTPMETMHDLGFLYLSYAVAMYKLTGDADMKQIGIKAADELAKRFHPKCGCIRAWGRMDYQIPDYVDSELAKNHPEWMVQENGKPTSDYSHNPNWYILDGSHPGAVEYLRKIIRWMRDDCGLRYFKLDFLAYGALPVGERYDKNMSAVESYRAGMRAMIEEAGEDSFILACNSPFWPTLGLCHGQRVTNDILRQWKLVSGNARELFYRNWQHQNLWINDPDCVVLERIDITRSNGRVRECTLTDAEFEFHKAFALCCGGMILSGDLLDSISEKSVDILKRLTDNMGEAAFFDSDDFTVGRFKEKPFICLFNWSGEEREVSANIPGKKSAYDFFTDEYIAEFTDTITLTLPPHGARSLFIKPAN